jgi:H+/Cl- antiporter ClcA
VTATSDAPEEDPARLIPVSTARRWIWRGATFFAMSSTFITLIGACFLKLAGLSHSFLFKLVHSFIIQLISAAVLSWIVRFRFLRHRALWDCLKSFIFSLFPCWNIDDFKKKYKLKIPGEEGWPREPEMDQWN